MKKIILSLLFVSLNACFSFVYAWNDTPEAEAEIKLAMQVSPDLAKGKNIYQSCAVCHSPRAWGNVRGHYPQIAGQHKSVIIKQIIDIRTGSRDNPTMYPFAQKRYLGNAENIANVAAYIAQLPMNPQPNKGSGIERDYGQQIYVKNCEACHGSNAEGDAQEFYPKLQGQNYHYLVRQLNWIQIGKRRNADADMLKTLHHMGGREIHAVADYITHIPLNEKETAPSKEWNNPDFSKGFHTANPLSQQ